MHDNASSSSPHQASAKQSLINRIVAFDHAVLAFLARRTLPKSVSIPLIFFVRIGDGWIWGVVALYLGMALPMAQTKIVVLHCLVAIAISLIIYWPLKLLVRRRRPFVLAGENPKVPPLDKYSFPSGHTMNNLAVSLTLALYLPHIFIPALGVPILLGALRILFGVHFLSDITGGAFLGAASYYIAKAIFHAFA